MLFSAFVLLLSGCSSDSVSDPPILGSIRVNPAGSGDYPTIQAAANAAIEGDTILAAPGTYTGDGNRDIRFYGKNLVLLSANGPEDTIIDCEGSVSERHFGFRFASGEDSTSIIDGFSIINGSYSYGCGISCSRASPTIQNCIISGNGVGVGPGIELAGASSRISNCVIKSHRDGGIKCFQSNSSVVIKSCIVSENSAEGGGGISLSRCPNVTISDCVISGNQVDLGTSGGIYCHDSNLLIENTLIFGNNCRQSWGGGLYASGNSSIRIRSCTIASNAAMGFAGGIQCAEANIEVEYSIIWGNCGSDDQRECRINPGSTMSFKCCAIDSSGVGGDGAWEYLGEQVFADPLFVNSQNCGHHSSGDYSLAPGSPCLPENNLCQILIGVLFD